MRWFLLSRLALGRKKGSGGNVGGDVGAYMNVKAKMDVTLSPPYSGWAACAAEACHGCAEREWSAVFSTSKVSVSTRLEVGVGSEKITHPGRADHRDKELEEDDDGRVESLPRGVPVPRMVFAVRQPANQPVTIPLEAQACQLLELLVPVDRLCPGDTARFRHDGFRGRLMVQGRHQELARWQTSILRSLLLGNRGPLYTFLQKHFTTWVVGHGEISDVLSATRPPLSPPRPNLIKKVSNRISSHCASSRSKVAS